MTLRVIELKLFKKRKENRRNNTMDLALKVKF